MAVSESPVKPDESTYKHNYYSILTASTFGNLADGIFKLSIPILAVSLTNSKTAISAVTGCLTLPWLIASLPAGALADRIDRVFMMRRVNLVRTLVLAILAGMLFLENESLTVLYIAALVLGTCEVLFDINAQATLPMIVPENKLARANSRLFAIEFAMNDLVGKALAGVLAGVAIYWSFGTAATSYFLASVALFRLVGNFKTPEPEVKKTMREDIGEGLKFLWHNKFLRNLALSVGAMEFWFEGVLSLIPVFVLAGANSVLNLNTSTYGVLMALLAVGAVLGTLTAERLEQKYHPVKVMAIANVASIPALAALAFSSSTAVFAVGIFLFGFSGIVFSVVSLTARQRLIPNQIFGRVNAPFRLAIYGAASLGAFVAGPISDAADLRFFFRLALIMIVALTVAMLFLSPLYDSALERLKTESA